MSRNTYETWVASRWNGKPRESDNVVPFPIVSALGLAGEVGEVVELLKKHYRDGKHPGDALKLELGDVLHYLVVITQAYGWDLQDLTRANVDKLEDRDAAKRRAGIVPDLIGDEGWPL